MEATTAKATARVQEAIPEDEPINPGRGRRVCPNCNQPTSSRSPVCRHCGFEVSRREKPTIEQLVAIVKELGGFDAVKQKIEQYHKIGEELEKLGGVDEAGRYLAQLESVRQL